MLMPRMSPGERRAALISAALAVMRRRGIAGTTARDVAAELGSSSGLIHHYVDSMDELVAEAFAVAAGEDLLQAETAVRDEIGAVPRLAAFFDAYARGDDDGMQLWLDAWSEAARRPALGRISRELNERWQGLLAGIIRDGIREGSMAAEDADSSAWRVLSLLDGLVLQTVAHGDVISRAQADAWARAGAEGELGLPAGSLRGAVRTP